MLIQGGHCERALAGGCEQTDPHFHAGFDSMRAYNADDNDRPERASRPYAADRGGFIFAEGAGIVVLETRAHLAQRSPQHGIGDGAHRRMRAKQIGRCGALRQHAA